MHEYIALIGHQPALSLAELSAALPDFIRVPSQIPDVVIFRTATIIDQAWLDRMGGIILIAKKVADDSMDLEDVPTLLAGEVQGMKGKVTFALRCIGIRGRGAERLGMTCKKHLKSLGIVSRFVGNALVPAKAIQLHDEGLLDPKKGIELLIASDGTELWVGRTVAAQNVKAYTRRDMEKPVRDTRVGLLPPKLAQVLINLGRFALREHAKKEVTSLYDPFAGTGVILLETLLQGIHVFASDIALKAVTGAEANIAWLRSTWKILKKDVSSDVWKQDATKPFTLKKTPDVIVTEGSLGPALKSRPTIKDADRYARDAADLTMRFLRNTAATLPGVPIVMTLPLWYAQKRPIAVPDIDALVSRCGYRLMLPAGISPALEERTSLIYRRPDQFVGREVIVLLPEGKK